MEKTPLLFAFFALIVFSCGKSSDDNVNQSGVSFEETAITVSEGELVATFTITLNGDIPEAFTLDYETIEGSATDGTDYISTNGTLSFSGTNGQSITVGVPIIEDNQLEPNEEFSVRLSNLSSSLVTINGDNSAQITINDQTDKSGNLLGTGASANGLLSNNNFNGLLIQIAYVSGFRPTDETMGNFMQFIEQHTFKEDITIEYLELDSPGEEDLTLQEIADLESDNRTAFNFENTLAIYIYFADAPSEGDDLDEGLVTLGAVYRNTSMVIFEQTIRTLAGRSLRITNTDVETATLNHEFGHLFGLVDIGTAPVNDHEDPEAPNHCNVEGCLMQAQLTFGSPAARAMVSSANKDLVSPCSLSGQSVLNMLEANAARNVAIVPVLDPECILDLQSNGGR